jgi:hypothetical protein
VLSQDDTFTQFSHSKQQKSREGRSHNRSSTTKEELVERNQSRKDQIHKAIQWILRAAWQQFGWRQSPQSAAAQWLCESGCHCSSVRTRGSDPKEGNHKYIVIEDIGNEQMRYGKTERDSDHDELRDGRI